jgi:hypothetical protein
MSRLASSHHRYPGWGYAALAFVIAIGRVLGVGPVFGRTPEFTLPRTDHRVSEPGRWPDCPAGFIRW